MSDLWILCPHGEVKAHSRRHWPNPTDEPEYESCPGGHPAGTQELIEACLDAGVDPGTLIVAALRRAVEEG